VDSNDSNGQFGIQTIYFLQSKDRKAKESCKKRIIV
jgi:hypothetical protein